jgi:hypothetical protein
MGKRHDKLGIKQTIQKYWMDRVLRLLLAGMSDVEIRSDLDKYLVTQKQSGGIGERGDRTYGMAIGILASWFSPPNELIGFRDTALPLAQDLPEEMWLPLHWAIISAAYPFWFNVARQVGRLLNLQGQITQAQVFSRLKEQYGDRETVARNARYTVRSFVAWGVLKDTGTKGCYETGIKLTLPDQNLAILMLEAALHAAPEGKGSLALLCNHPAFFPFRFPILTGDFIARHTDRIDVIRHGLDNDLLKLKGI